jgi:hypothetical protein
MVADGDAVVVYSVLAAPQPVRTRPKKSVCMLDLVYFDVRTAQPIARSVVGGGNL